MTTENKRLFKVGDLIMVGDRFFEHTAFMGKSEVETNFIPWQVFDTGYSRPAKITIRKNKPNFMVVDIKIENKDDPEIKNLVHGSHGCAYKLLHIESLQSVMTYEDWAFENLLKLEI